MKYLKMLGLAVLATAAPMAFAGSASATTLTSPAGTTLGVGSQIELSGSFEAHGTTACLGFLKGQVEQAGGASETVRIPLSLVTFTECDNATVSAAKGGSLEIHTNTPNADGNGTVRWNGAEFTVLTHSFFFGTTHCLYGTTNSYFAALTGSKSLGGKTATLTFGITGMTQQETDAICSSEPWTSSYTVTTPDYLDVD